MSSLFSWLCKKKKKKKKKKKTSVITLFYEELVSNSLEMRTFLIGRGVYVRIERGRFKSSRLYARYRESRERKQEQVGREKKGETHGVVGWNEAETQLMENV